MEKDMKPNIDPFQTSLRRREKAWEANMKRRNIDPIFKHPHEAMETNMKGRIDSISSILNRSWKRTGRRRIRRTGAGTACPTGASWESYRVIHNVSHVRWDTLPWILLLCFCILAFAALHLFFSIRYKIILFLLSRKKPLRACMC
jgi:hypothetical protein